jgi:hypothetical protein
MDWDYELLDAAEALLRAHAEFAEALEEAKSASTAAAIEAPAPVSVN